MSLRSIFFALILAVSGLNSGKLAAQNPEVQQRNVYDDPSAVEQIVEAIESQTASYVIAYNPYIPSRSNGRDTLFSIAPYKFSRSCIGICVGSELANVTDVLRTLKKLNNRCAGEPSAEIRFLDLNEVVFAKIYISRSGRCIDAFDGASYVVEGEGFLPLLDRIHAVVRR